MPRQKKQEDQLCRKVSVSFIPDQYEELMRYCEVHERSLAWVVRKALNDWLAKHKDDPVE